MSLWSQSIWSVALENKSTLEGKVKCRSMGSANSGESSFIVGVNGISQFGPWSEKYQGQRPGIQLVFSYSKYGKREKSKQRAKP